MSYNKYVKISDTYLYTLKRPQDINIFLLNNIFILSVVNEFDKSYYDLIPYLKKKSGQIVLNYELHEHIYLVLGHNLINIAYHTASL